MELKSLTVAAFRRYAMMFGMSIVPFASVRVAILKACGVHVGHGCYIGFNVICDTNFSFLITIGSNVTISHNTSIFAHTSTPAVSYLSSLYNDVKPVTIGDGAWIGANCIVLPGVTIGEHCMIGAGSVVTKSTEAYSLYAGNPCRKIKSLPLPEAAKNA